MWQNTTGVLALRRRKQVNHRFKVSLLYITFLWLVSALVAVKRRSEWVEGDESGSFGSSQVRVHSGQHEFFCVV